MTTHYEKIQALGNRMASNLETMGVSASFGDGGLTLADKILQIQHFTDGLLLWADKDIIQTGDTVNVYALLLDERKAVSGETILFNGLETTQTLVVNTETSVGNNYRFTNIPTLTDYSQKIYLNEEQTVYLTKGNQRDLFIWVPSTPSAYAIPIDDGSPICVENGIIKLKSNGADWTYDASSTNTNKITSTISDVTITETMQGTTGSDGVATVSYTGVGAGNLNVQATHGTLQSETYSILDALMIDRGTTDNHNDSVWNSVTYMSRGAEYTTISNETSNASKFIRIEGDINIELDVLTSMPMIESLFSVNNSATILKAITGNDCIMSSNEWKHIKITIQNNKLTVENGTISNYDVTDFNRIYLRSGGNYQTCFKNLMIYPI